MSDTSDYVATESSTPVTDAVNHAEDVYESRKAEVKEAVNETVDAVAEAVRAPVVAAETPVFTNSRSVKSIIESNPLYPQLKALALWRDPVKTGLFFGIATCSYILLHWLDYTVLSLFAYLLFALLAVCFAYSSFVVIRGTWLRGAPNTENPFVANFRGYNFHISKEEVVPQVDTALELANVAIDKFVAVFFCTNKFLSLKYLAYFYVAAIVGQWFSGLTIAYLAALAFFVWPRLYEEKKREIDNGVETLNREYQKYTDLAISKLPPQVKQFTGLSEAKKKRM